jgi:hypothetical protein
MASKFNVDAFTSALEHGGARTNLMSVSMDSPSGGIKKANFTFMCKASNIPGSTLTPIEVPYFGRNVKLAGESREFAPLTTTVVNDEGREIYVGMVAWMKDLNDPKLNKTKKGLFGSRISYCTDIQLKMYKKDGDTDQSWDFINCWPSNMSAIDLNWDSVNTIQEFTIDWQYDYYLHSQAKISKNA